MHEADETIRFLFKRVTRKVKMVMAKVKQKKLIKGGFWHTLMAFDLFIFKIDVRWVWYKSFELIYKLFP